MAKDTNSQEYKNTSNLPTLADSLNTRIKALKQSDIDPAELEIETYQLLDKSHGNSKELLAAIPEGRKHGGKYSRMRKIAFLLVNNEKVENYLLAQVIYGNVLSQRGKSKRFAKYEYNKKHHQIVKNHLVALIRRWKRLGYTITQRKEYSKLIPNQ